MTYVNPNFQRMSTNVIKVCEYENLSICYYVNIRICEYVNKEYVNM